MGQTLDTIKSARVRANFVTSAFEEGWFERLGVAVAMLPDYVISTLFWLMVWALALAEVFDLG
jgi:hypothetical protein